MPSYADEYQLWASPRQPQRPNTGGSRTLGGWGGQSPSNQTGHVGGFADSGYAYNPNMSSNDFIKENVKKDLLSPTSAWTMATPSGHVAQAYRAFAGRKTFKKQRDKERAKIKDFNTDLALGQARAPSNYLNAVDPTSQTALYANARMGAGAPATREELQAKLDQEEVQNLRQFATGRINQFFDDPNRQSEYERLTSNQLKADTQNIGTTFDNADTKAKLATARQGLTGGSVEAENSAQLGGQRSAALVDAAQGANKTFSNLTARDRAMREQLLSLVNSDDPYMRQAAAAQLRGMQEQTATDAYQEAANQTRQEAGQFQQNQMSQSIGGGLTGLANLVRQDPNRGTNISAWYTPARN